MLAPHAAAAEFGLPELGNPSSVVLSGIAERNIGREFMRSVRKDMDFVSDLDINHYINRLGNRLAANSSRSDEKFYFYTIKDGGLNAFAVPGGHITVFTGIIDTAENEDELAAVLAHEIAHVNRRHFARMVEKEAPTSVSVLAAVLGAILIGGSAGGALVATTGAAIAEKRLVYRREFEREADALGIRILHRSGFNPDAMHRFFERMQHSNRAQGGGEAPEYLRSHPLTVNRISESRARAAAYAPLESSPSRGFLRIKARIEALYGGTDHKRLAARFAEQLADNGERDDLRYGYAITLSALGRLNEAAAEVDALLARDPQEAAYYRLRAEIAVRNKDHDLVTPLFEDGLAKTGDDASLRLYYADALNRIGQSARAEELLRIEARSNRSNPELQKIYSRAAAQSGKNTESLQALAEYHYHTFNYRDALKALQQARAEAPQDRYLRASIEARIKEIEKETAPADS